MKRNRQFLVAMVALIALTAACGDSKKKDAASGDTATTMAANGSATTAAGTDAGDSGTGVCAVVTKANVEKAVGVPMGDGKVVSEDGSTSACAFQSADHNTNVTVVKFERAGDLIKNTKAADKSAVPIQAGDEAVMNAKLGKITMQIGEIGITISITPAPSAEALTALAKTATPG